MIRLACSCSMKRLDIGANFALRHENELRLEFLHNFSQRELAVAKFEDNRGPFLPRLIAPSGKSTTGASVVPPQRHPAASRGILASVSSATASLSSPRLDAKRPRRRPARLRRKQSRARQAAPIVCHTCRAMPGSRPPARRACAAWSNTYWMANAASSGASVSRASK